MDSNPISVPNLCEWCGGVGTCRCGFCHDVYYCSMEHQMQHWEIHQKVCKKSSPPVMSTSSHNMSLPMNHNLPTSNISHLSSSNINPNIASINISPMPLPNISQNIPSPVTQNIQSLNISQNIPSPVTQNMQSLNISQNMPSPIISQNMPSPIISQNMPSPNISQNMPLSSVSPNVSSSSMNQSINVPVTSNMTFAPTANWNQVNVPFRMNEAISRLPSSSNVFIPNNPCIPSDFNMACAAEEILSSFNYEMLSADNSFWDLIDACSAQNVSDLDLYLGKDTTNQMQIPQNVSSASNISNANSSSIITDEDTNLIECCPLNDICKNVIHDLNMYGICVLDKFIGSKRGHLVLDEVKNLYSSGVFEKGKLVRTSAYIASEKIRSDVTTWVDGTEPYCPNIGYLMQKLDLVIATCNKMPKNGQLSKYKLHRRTKAMVACYPGNGTHYKKHVDNPNKDGRCITCIYYLNENWDVTRHGGILRMYPSVRDSDIAQIAPIFDRMIFFWSDRRNPHEVLPARAMRFAITVWYFDADEREASLLKAAQEKGQHAESSSFN